ncbi:MAG: hypothetical protein OK474_06850 [Thaumarchaeota archaeon]|nr:hypothetical protein [Nitrososphaerota archaeon]
MDTTVASGSFTITIDLDAGAGMATAHGNIDNTITGVCSGHDSVSYTFQAIGEIDTISNNLTLAFEPPTPDTSSVAETCPDQGSGTVGYSWPSVVPETVTLPAVYGAKVEGTSGEVSYEIILA